MLYLKDKKLCLILHIICVIINILRNSIMPLSQRPFKEAQHNYLSALPPKSNVRTLLPLAGVVYKLVSVDIKFSLKLRTLFL